MSILKNDNLAETLRHTSESRRRLPRNRYYRNEFPRVTFRYSEAEYDAEVVDLSPDGIGLIFPETFNHPGAVGSTIKIRFANDSERLVTGTVVYMKITSFSGRLRVRAGIRFDSELRVFKNFRHQRYECHEFFRPLAYCEHPIHFAETLHLQVRDISSDGLGLVAKGSGNSLAVGLELGLTLLVPTLGEFFVQSEITHLDADANEDLLLLGVKMKEPSPSVLTALAGFVILSQPSVSIRELREHGFAVEGIEHAIRFSYPQSKADMDDILSLRLVAAKEAGRWVGCNDPQVMIDAYDGNSRHLIARVGDNVVASARVVFNDGQRERSEHSSYGIDIPEWLWKKGFIECSRVCTHPDYRGSDLFLAILRHLGRITIQTGHSHMVLNCVDSLVPIYERVGAKSLGNRFTTPFMGANHLNLLYIDIYKSQVGSGLNPSNWNVVARSISDYLLRRGDLKIGRVDRFIRSVWKVWGVIALKRFFSMRREKALAGREAVLDALKDRVK